MIENIKLSDFPRSSGVYLFKDLDGVVIYVGSSKDLYNRMGFHRNQIKNYPNVDCQSKLYQYLQENYFEVELQLEENYKQIEQELIEKYSPKFNCRKAYTGSDSFKEYSKQYYELHKEEMKQYYELHKEEIKQYYNQYNNQLCNYNGEILKLPTLAMRFKREGIPHSTLEAKKYLIL